MSAGSPTDAGKRALSSGAKFLDHEFYSDASRTQPWGSTSGTNTVGGTGTGSNQALSVYGRVASQSTPSPGTYTDSVVVTVTY